MKKIVLFFAICSLLFLISKKSLGDNLVDCIPDPPAGSTTVTPTYDSVRNVYTFLSTAMGVKYEYNANIGWSFPAIKAFRLSVGDYFYPSLGGLFFTNNGTWINPWNPNLSYINLSKSISGDTLKTVWKATFAGASKISTFIYNIDLSMIGRTLKTHIYSTSLGNANFQYYSIDLDRSDSCYLPFLIEVPVLSDMNIMLTNGVYTSLFFDWTKANASDIYAHDTIHNANSIRYSQRCYYYPNTAGNRKRLDETVYLTVSPIIDEVFPNIPNPVSTYKDTSASKIVMDWWSDYFYFYKDPRFLKTLYANGIENVWAIMHVWQRAGYDRQLPETFPAKDTTWYLPELASMDSLINLLDTFPARNYLLSLHENYTSYSYDTPSYGTNNSYHGKSPTGDSILTWNMAWFGGPDYRLYLMKPNMILTPLNYISNQIHSSYGTNSSYLDFHTNARLGAFVDFDASIEGIADYGRYAATINNYKILGDELRNIHKGPVSAEGGAFMSYFAGYFDDFEGEIRTNTYPSNCRSCTGTPAQRGGFFRPLLVDFDLKKMHKKSFMHGVGYKARFFQNDQPEGVAQGRSNDSLLMYVATELAYGRGGEFTSWGYNPNEPNEHAELFLYDAKLQHEYVLPVQKYLKDEVTSIEYYDGSFKSASEYIRNHANNWNVFSSSEFMGRVKVHYTNGAVVYVNRSNTDNWTVSVPGNRVWYSYHKTGGGTDTLYSGTTQPGSTMVLPKQSGWLVVGPLCPDCPEEELPFERGGREFKFSLSQNYPNPFNPTSTIKYSLAKAEFVTIKIYDMLGREVMLLENTFKDAGEYSVVFDGSKLASGVYFYKLDAYDYVNIKKMLLIK